MPCDKKFDISVVGLSCVDCIGSSSSLQWGVQNPIEDLRIGSGGVGNALASLSGLGLKVGVCARVGMDVFGDYLFDFWRKLEVDTSGVSRDPDRSTGLAFILSHDSERTPFYAPGANAALGLRDIPAEVIESSRCLLIFFAGALPSLDGDPMLQLVRKCREAGTTVILDVTDSATADYAPIPTYLPYVNLVINSEEGRRLTGRQSAGEMLADLEIMAGDSSNLLAVTRQGGVLVSALQDGKRKHFDIDSPFYGKPVNNVVGAGDGFRAGLAAFMCRHWDDYCSQRLDYSRACLYASAVSYLYLSRSQDIRPFSEADIDALLEGA
jgi:2-dehydro-3-deoxygluconokinase